MKNFFFCKSQDPAVFSWEAQQIMKQALFMRYSLIPYWYTLYYQASTISTTVVQPLVSEYGFFFRIYMHWIQFIGFRFTNDPNTYNIDKQFLVGSAILVSANFVSVNIQLLWEIIAHYYSLEFYFYYCLHSTRYLV